MQYCFKLLVGIYEKSPRNYRLQTVRSAGESYYYTGKVK